MQKHNPANERIKRKYFSFLKEAKRHGEATVDAAAKALNRFEVYTRYRDFKAFHFEQAIAFKKHLAEQKGRQTGEKLSKGRPCMRPLPSSSASSSGLRGNQAISPASSMPMRSISICLRRTRGSLPQNGNKRCRPSNRSSMSSIKCQSAPR